MKIRRDIDSLHLLMLTHACVGFVRITDCSNAGHEPLPEAVRSMPWLGDRGLVLTHRGSLIQHADRPRRRRPDGDDPPEMMVGKRRAGVPKVATASLEPTSETAFIYGA